MKLRGPDPGTRSPKAQAPRSRPRADAKAIRQLEAVINTALAHLSLDHLLDELLVRVRTLLGADTAAILLLEGDELVTRAVKGLGEERRIRTRVGGGFAGRVAAEKRPIFVENVEDVDPAHVLHPVLVEEGIRSLLGVPILFEGQVIGVLHVGTRERRQFDRGDAQLLQVVADRIGLGIEYAQLYRKAEETSRLKDEFLATLSHELRTPLTSVLAWMWMLRRGRLDAPAVERARDTMEKSIRSLLHIIDDLLDVSRAIRGQLRLDVRPIGLVPVIQAAVDAVRPAASARDIRLRTTIDSDAGLVQGDPSRLQQVVWNLLTNAIKFTPAGGRVHVHLERADSAALVTVSDSGPGISPEFLPHAFERFRQADASPTRAQGGLGLGLDIVRHLIELHGGTVKVESPGEMGGATFTVTLPLHEPGRAAADPASERTEPAKPELAVAPSSALDGARVLIVDDEADTREVLSVLLSGAGAEVRTSASAADALVILTRWQPDVLLADIAMPGEDGYALLSKLRALTPRQGGEIPALALTAYAHPQDRERALAAGFHDYVVKPFEPPALVAAIAKLARTRRPSRRAAPVRSGGIIMLVDDDPGTREYSCAVLKDCGYRVLAAEGGEEALRVWAKHRDEIDLVVTDLMMPRTSGVDVYRTLREQRSDVPVIVVSGYPLVAEMLGARQEGVVECLEKPVAPEQLAASVRRALAREACAG